VLSMERVVGTRRWNVSMYAKKDRFDLLSTCSLSSSRNVVQSPPASYSLTSSRNELISIRTSAFDQQPTWLQSPRAL